MSRVLSLLIATLMFSLLSFQSYANATSPPPAGRYDGPGGGLRIEADGAGGGTFYDENGNPHQMNPDGTIDGLPDVKWVWVLEDQDGTRPHIEVNYYEDGKMSLTQYFYPPIEPVAEIDSTANGQQYDNSWNDVIDELIRDPGFIGSF